MGTTRYVALLRGVNVGGRNPVAMSALREAFEAAGFQAVSTYIQSGQVLFESDAPRDSLEGDLEVMLERRFGIPLVVVLRRLMTIRSWKTTTKLLSLLDERRIQLGSGDGA